MIGNNELICPITLETFNDPVTCDDGVTYERAAIERWFKEPGSMYYQDNELRLSPMTGIPITKKFVTNRAIKDMLEQINFEQPVTWNNIHLSDQKQNEMIQIEKTLENLDKIDGNSVDVEIHGCKEPNENFIDVYVSIVPPKEYNKMIQVFICVVDLSASMNYAAIEELNDENCCYSRLDLVKYSLDNIVQNCDENDYFGLVVFSDNAEAALPLTKMDINGKKTAKETIYKLGAVGCTNLWSGIYEGLLMSGSPICHDKNVSMIVLTDGISNINPPGGLFETLEKELNEQPVDCTIHTLGYGYEIDCRLLHDIAMKLGNGVFCYIPDCTMIGTNVISLIAKIKSSFARNVEIELNVENGDWFPTFKDNFNLETQLYKQNIITSSKNRKLLIRLGNLDYDQKRDLILAFKRDKKHKQIEIGLKIKYTVGESRFIIDRIIKQSEIKCHNLVFIKQIDERNMFVEMLIEILKQRKQLDRTDEAISKASKIASDFIEKLKTNNKESDYYREFDNFKNVYEGQLLKALSKSEWYEKWGYSHFLYLLSSHIRTFNANFKDPSIQQYGGKLFLQYREECELIFCTLPQPKPSIQMRVLDKDQNKSNKEVTKKPTVNISTICLNKSADCFIGDSLVTLLNGEIKRVCKIQPGDKLKSWNGKSCTVKCVIKSKCWKEIKIAKIDNLLITPYHPIFYDDKWSFPNDVGQITTINCDYLYNMVVDCENVVLVDGYPCVTWGHTFTEGVVMHPFFGSNKIVDCLKVMNGWDQGYITIDLAFVSRDKNNGLINGIYQSDNHQMVCVQNTLLNANLLPNISVC